MPVDPELLDYVLRTPLTQDVADSPLVTGVILADPANAADLVPALDDVGTDRSANARRVLAMFGPEAAPFAVRAVVEHSEDARADVLQCSWAMLTGESEGTIRETLAGMSSALGPLFEDRTALPDRMPAYVERDFRGRLCDLAFVVVSLLLNPSYDQSSFRLMEDTERDDEILRLRQQITGPGQA
jgi:hypothetical protein